MKNKYQNAFLRAKKRRDKKVQKYLKGGELTQYNAPSHKNGGKLVDINGNPTKVNPTAEVEGTESSLRSNGSNYVFSDELGTSALAHKVLEDFNDNSPLSMSARRNAFKKVRRLNEQRKADAQAQLPKMGNTDNSSRSYSADKIYEKKLGGDITSGVLSGASDFIGALDNDSNSFNAFTNQAADIIPQMNLGGDPTDYHLKLIRDARNPVPNSLDSLATPNVDLSQSKGLRPDSRDNVLPTPNKLPTLGSTLATPTAPALKPLAKSTFFDRVKEDMLTKGRELGESQDRASIIQGISTVGSALNSFGRPAKETPRFTNFNEGDKLTGDLGIDNQALKNQNNLSFNTTNYLAKDSTRTPGQYFNRLRANATRAGQTNAQLELQAKQYNDNVNLNLAGREDRKATSVSNEQKRLDTANAQNIAKSQDLQQQFLNTMYDMGTAVDKKRYIEETTQNLNGAKRKQFLLDLATVNMNSDSFKLDSKILSDFIKNPDKYDEETIMNELIKYKG